MKNITIDASSPPLTVNVANKYRLSPFAYFLSFSQHRSTTFGPFMASVTVLTVYCGVKPVAFPFAHA